MKRSGVLLPPSRPAIVPRPRPAVSVPVRSGSPTAQPAQEADDQERAVNDLARQIKAEDL